MLFCPECHKSKFPHEWGVNDYVCLNCKAEPKKEKGLTERELLIEMINRLSDGDVHQLYEMLMEQ